jgi:hypothetical protein
LVIVVGIVVAVELKVLDVIVVVEFEVVAAVIKKTNIYCIVYFYLLIISKMYNLYVFTLNLSYSHSIK